LLGIYEVYISVKHTNIATIYKDKVYTKVIKMPSWMTWEERQILKMEGNATAFPLR
jgi:hypothetical protein